MPVANSPKILGISELALWVDDLDLAIAFYRDMLGFEVDDIAPGSNAFLHAGDLVVALFVPTNPGTALATEYLARVGSPRGDVYHAAFRLAPDTLDDFTADLKAKGLEVR